MKLIKLLVHGHIILVLEHDSVLIGSVPKLNHTIVLNSIEKNIFCSTYHPLHIKRFVYPEYQYYAVLAYGLNQLTQEEIKLIPLEVYQAHGNWWSDLKPI